MFSRLVELNGLPVLRETWPSAKRSTARSNESGPSPVGAGLRPGGRRFGCNGCNQSGISAESLAPFC